MKFSSELLISLRSHIINIIYFSEMLDVGHFG